MWIYPYDHHHREFGEPDLEALYSNPFARGFSILDVSVYNAQVAADVERQNAQKAAKAAAEAVKNGSTATTSPTVPKTIRVGGVGAEEHNPDGASPVYDAQGHLDGYRLGQKDGSTGFYDPVGTLTGSAFYVGDGAVYFNTQGQVTSYRSDSADGTTWYDAQGHMYQMDLTASASPRQSFKLPVSDNRIAQAAPPRVRRNSDGAIMTDFVQDHPGFVKVDASSVIKDPAPIPAPSASQVFLQSLETVSLSKGMAPRPLEAGNTVFAISENDPGRVDIQVAPPSVAATNPVAAFFDASRSVLDLVAAARGAAPPPPRSGVSPPEMPVAPPRPIAETADFYSFGGPLLAGRTIADSSRDAKLEQPSIGSLNPSDRKLARALLQGLEPAGTISSSTPTKVFSTPFNNIGVDSDELRYHTFSTYDTFEDTGSDLLNELYGAYLGLINLEIGVLNVPGELPMIPAYLSRKHIIFDTGDTAPLEFFGAMFGISSEVQTVSADISLFAQTSRGASGRVGYQSSKVYSSGKNYSRAEILEAFHGSDHTPTTREVSDAIKSGKLIVVFDATMESAGAASSGNLIHVNPTQEIYDVLSTLTHEGRHALDMSAKLIPLPTSLLGRSHEMIAFAELRAFAAASDFAVLNNFTEAGAFGNAEKHPFQVADAIATGYGLVIDDLRLREIVEKALSGDWR